MSRNAVVWLDDTEARIFSLTRVGQTTWQVEPDDQHLQHPAKLDGAFFDRVAGALEDAAQILIVGPGVAKHELMRHLSRRDSDMIARVAGLESMERPSEAEIVKLAKQCFRASGRPG